MRKKVKLLSLILTLVLVISISGCSNELSAKDFANKESCIMKFQSMEASAITDSNIQVKDDKVQKKYFTGKGYTIEVYEATKDTIILKYKEYPDDKDINNVKGKEYFDKKENTNEIILQGPIEEGTKFGNFEIVKVGVDPELDCDLDEGTCILVKSKEIKDDVTYEEELYFKEGYGLVKKVSYTDGVLMEESVLKYYEKK